MLFSRGSSPSHIQGSNPHLLSLLHCSRFFTAKPPGKPFVCVCVCVCVCGEREREGADYHSLQLVMFCKVIRLCSVKFIIMVTDEHMTKSLLPEENQGYVPACFWSHCINQSVYILAFCVSV